MIPTWLTVLSWMSLALGVLSAAWIVAKQVRRPARMAVMNLVWPISALFGSVLVVWFHRRYGHAEGDQPFAATVAKGALHCGAGCTLGDICAETLALAVPAVLVPLGFPSLFDERIFAVWILDYIFAFGIGIVFQYYAIAPMRELGVAEGLRAALKADTASLTAWQVGMYGLMAIAHFWVFKHLLGANVDATRPEFWFAMQIAMLAGFATAYPINWWLIRSGIKEAM